MNADHLDHVPAQDREVLLGWFLHDEASLSTQSARPRAGSR
jgi:hypothetical protein